MTQPFPSTGTVTAAPPAAELVAGGTLGQRNKVCQTQVPRQEQDTVNHEDTAKYIIAVYRGIYGLPRLEFGNPEEVANNWPDAAAFYMTDNFSCTMVRLEYEKKLIGVTDYPETKHTWRYAESVLQPHLEDYQSIEDRPTWLTDSDADKNTESYFGALKKQVIDNNPHISRGGVYASVVTTKGASRAPAAEPASQEGSETNV